MFFISKWLNRTWSLEAATDFTDGTQQNVGEMRRFYTDNTCFYIPVIFAFALTWIPLHLIYYLIWRSE